MKEDIFLNIITQTLPESATYIGDDTAYISEKDLILTQDTLVEDVHFLTSTISPYYLGRKSIAVNLSDIAAAGGVANYILISLSMPKHIEEAFVKEFYEGVASICKEHDVVVVGGDLTAADKITISICALGFGNGLTPANRKNAKPGYIVAVTGPFGLSKAGFEDPNSKFIQAHINPTPRLKEGRKILEIAKTPAMMDASDGLADALHKISLCSNVNIEVEYDKIPREDSILKSWVLFGGEDYELVATMPEEAYKKLKEVIYIEKIGVVKEAKGEHRVMIDSEPLSFNSHMFRHFE